MTTSKSTFLNVARSVTSTKFPNRVVSIQNVNWWISSSAAPGSGRQALAADDQNIHAISILLNPYSHDPVLYTTYSGIVMSLNPHNYSLKYFSKRRRKSQKSVHFDQNIHLFL